MAQCITSYQAKYFAHSLTRRLPANDGAKFTATLQDARVDLTPHQIDAALFAFKSPLWDHRGQRGPLITSLSTRMMFKRESVDLSPVISVGDCQRL